MKQKTHLHLLKNLFFMISILLIATLFAAVDHQMHRVNIVSIYLLAIVIIARITTGYLWGILSSFLAILCINYFFIYPYFAFNFMLADYPSTFIIMAITALLINLTTAELKLHSKASESRRKNAEKLYSIMKDLIFIDSKAETIEITLSHLRSYFNTKVEFYPETSTENLKKRQGNWYLEPLVTPTKHYGAIAIDISNLTMSMTDFEHFLEIISSRTSMVLEHLDLQELQQQTLLDSEKEKMRSNLLRAISHDLRTPLTTMLGSTTTLLDNSEQLDQSQKKELLLGIQTDCEWLIRMVENLLSVTRIREGETRLATTLEPAEEIIASAINKLKKRCPKTNFRVQVPDDLLMVSMDGTLIEQVIINLCENSIYHSGCPSPIDILLEQKGNFAIFTIRDYGRGISTSQLDHLFDGYASYSKSSQDTYKGMGIGLSICMTIIKAHNGTIRGYNNIYEQSGASFEFALPMEVNNYE